MIGGHTSDLAHKFRKNLLLVILIDIVLFTISYAGSYLLRFDLKFSQQQYFNFRNTLFPIILLKVLIFYYYRLRTARQQKANQHDGW